MEACLTVIQDSTGGQEEEEVAVYRVVSRDLWRVSDALARIRGGLAAAPEGGDMTGFVPHLPAAPDRASRLKAAVASTLLACLELARNGELCLEQPSAWGAIGVSPGGGRSGCVRRQTAR